MGLLTAAAPLLGVLMLASLAASASHATIKPFSLADVELAGGSEFKENMDLNLRYLMTLEVDRLAFNFRVTAGLEAPGEPFGGWEDRNVEVRGQFMGHYLTAMAYAYRNTGDDKYKQRASEFVDALKECQDALDEGGYLSAFPSEHFDRLEALQPVWAPYYVIHKIMAGLLDQHTMAGNEHSLDMVTKMADYFCGRIDKVIDEKGQTHWESVLENEFGGMNEVLYHLSMESGEEMYAECAHHFDKPVFYKPMVEGTDVFAGLHANTHLAQVNGFGARYESTGDEEARTAVKNFFRILTSNHSFSTGGSNWYEHWYPARTLGDGINVTDASVSTEESCTQYNVLKIARYLFTWTGKPELADFYERAILNDVIGIQHKHKASPSGSGSGGGGSSGSMAEISAEHAEHAGLSHGMHGHGHGHHHHRDHNHDHPHGHHHHHHMHAPGRMHGHGQWHQMPMHPNADLAGAGASMAGSGSPAAHAAVDSAGMSAAYAAQPRPANYKVVSWPDDPGRHFRAAAGTSAEPSPGVYIYFLPLGAGLSKGDQRAWNHGWGDPFNTFWCCYGTAVESLSKLADSIFFRRMPSPSSVAATGDVPASPHGAAEQLPELFVNQLVSSKLRWRELGMNLTLDADIYGPVTAALVKLKLILGEDEEGADPQYGKGPSRRFVVNWRVPSWAESDGLKVSVNGKEQNDCTRGARLADAAEGTSPPAYGQGARYCSLGPDWADGDTIEAEMPMRYAVEDLNDDREEMRGLKAIMMGPLMLAGLTDDTNDLDADPDRIADAISIPDTQGLVSLEAASGGQLLSRRPEGTAALVPKAQVAASTAAAMDATFRLAPPLHCGALGLAEGAGEWVSLESMSRPGFFLAQDGQGSLLLRQPSPGQEGDCGAVFAKRAVAAEPGGLRGCMGEAVELEPVSAPGTRLSLAAAAGDDGDMAAGQAPTLPLRLRLAPAAAPKYPPGAREVKGRNRSYLLLPIGQIMDERYTAYFNFIKGEGVLEVPVGGQASEQVAQM